MSYLSDLLGDAYKEGMTEEEISAALEAKKQKGDSDLAKLKNLLDKANSEAAKYKTQLKEKQTADEQAAAEQKEFLEKITQENAELKRSMAIADNMTKLLGIGYTSEMASESAAAMADGNMAKVIEIQGKFSEMQMKNKEAELLRQTPRPGVGAENPGGTLDYDKMIAEAQANGDNVAAAYYTRLKGQEAQSGTNNN